MRCRGWLNPPASTSLDVPKQGLPLPGSLDKPMNLQGKPDMEPLSMMRGTRYRTTAPAHRPGIFFGQMRKSLDTISL